MTIPDILTKALRRKYCDQTMQIVYPATDWDISASSAHRRLILTLSTSDGFNVAFAETPSMLAEFAAAEKILGMDEQPDPSRLN